MKRVKRYISVFLVVVLFVSLSVSGSALAPSPLQAIVDLVCGDIGVKVLGEMDLGLTTLSAIQTAVGRVDATPIIAVNYSTNTDFLSSANLPKSSFSPPAGVNAAALFNSFSVGVGGQAMTNVTDTFMALELTWPITAPDGADDLSPTAKAQLLNAQNLGVVFELENKSTSLLVGNGGLFSWAQLTAAEAANIVRSGNGFAVSIRIATFDGTAAPSLAGTTVLVGDGLVNGKISDPAWLVQLGSGGDQSGDWVDISPSKDNPHTGK